MLTRLTSTDENKATLVSTVPVKRLAGPEEIAHVIAFVGIGECVVHDWCLHPGGWGMIADEDIRTLN